MRLGARGKVDRRFESFLASTKIFSLSLAIDRLFFSGSLLQISSHAARYSSNLHVVIYFCPFSPSRMKSPTHHLISPGRTAFKRPKKSQSCKNTASSRAGNRSHSLWKSFSKSNFRDSGYLSHSLLVLEIVSSGLTRQGICTADEAPEQLCRCSISDRH